MRQCAARNKGVTGILIPAVIIAPQQLVYTSAIARNVFVKFVDGRLGCVSSLENVVNCSASLSDAARWGVHSATAYLGTMMPHVSGSGGETSIC